MKIAIVDNEKKWIEVVKQQIKDYSNAQVDISTYESGKVFLEAQEKFDVVLMNIQMSQGNGFDTIKKYRKWNDEVIFFVLNTHTEVGGEGYQVEAFRYIDKVEIKKELQETFVPAKFCYKKEQRISLPIKNIGKKKIPVKKIIYFEVELRQVKLHTDNGEYICMEQISKLEKQLKKFGFFMPHRSYLVNFEWVGSFDARNIVMKNGDHLILSRRRYKEWKTRYLEWKLNAAKGE